LLRRRATGATLRELAADCGVAHTTLGRYFGRPGIAKQVKEIRGSERQAAAARRSEERELLRKVREAVKAEAELEQQLAVRRSMLAARRAARGRPRSDEAAWLDERDERELTRADRGSGTIDLAAEAVAAGGGLQEVVEATGLRTLANVGRLIDPAILLAASKNDAIAKALAGPVREPPRRLVPDAELLPRRAAGQSLRQLAADYGVTHTTLGRYFQRPEVTKQLHEARRNVPTE
jgi:lambda repressor-like predicted transcriptional regulator